MTIRGIIKIQSPLCCFDGEGLFFFSSRRRHTRFDCDWSSDVCSSDLKTKRQWLRTFGIFTAALVLVLGAFGAAMAWAGAAVAAKVTTPWAREAIASIALTVVGVLALVVALGELGVIRPLLPQVRTVPTGPGPSSLRRRALIIALAFGATMAIFSPLSAYALIIGWVAASQSPWLGAVTLMAYGRSEEHT